MLNHHKTLRAKQHLFLTRETVRLLLSPAFAGNDPKNPPNDPQRKGPQDPEPPTPGCSKDGGPSCAIVCP